MFQICNYDPYECSFFCQTAVDGMILYTALNSPSLIFALCKSETELLSLEFALFPIFLHYPLHIIQFSQLLIHLQFRGQNGQK